MAYQFNPPPGWPTPPQGWSPPEGWEPDASWPTPPQDWQFWVEESAAGSAATPAAGPQQSQPQQPDPTQQLSAASFGESSQQTPQSGPGSSSTPAPGYDPTQQLPSQHSGNQHLSGQGFGVPGGYSQDPPYQTAPAPYSGEPTAQLPYSTDPAAFGAAPPSYAAGGFAGQGGQGNQGGYPGQQGFGPGGPGGPGDPGKKKNNVGLLVAIIAGAVLILGLGTFAVVNALSGGSDDPTADPTTSTSEPTDDPTTTDPTDDPTTDAPTDDPTTDAPTDDPSTDAPTTDAPTTDAPDPNAGGGAAPAGTVELGIGAPYEVRDFDDALEATATLQEMTWDPTCNSSFGGDPEGRLLALRFDVTVANPTPDGEAFSMNGLYFNAYSDAASTGSAWSLFCEMDPVLPDDIQPGATVSGWIVVDIPEGSTWVTYEPTFGMGGDSAAWRLPS